MRPSRSSRSTRRLFDADQTLPGLRRVNQSVVRSASSARPPPSIQPKQSASSTPSSYVAPGRLEPARGRTSQAPRAVS
jgi:hypothetical protein